MNALLWKDLTSIKLTLLVMFAFATVYSIGFCDGGPLAFFIGPAIASTVVGTSLNLDDKAGWMKFAVSSGINRKTIARNKMVLALISTTAGLFAGALALAICSLEDELDLDTIEVLSIIVFGYAFGIFTSSAMIFSCYRFDPGYCGLFAAIIIGASAGLMVGASELLENLITDVLWFFPIMAVVFMCLASVFYVLAENILVHKDF